MIRTTLSDRRASDPWQGWPWDARIGEGPRPADTPPTRGLGGTFVVYHGTGPKQASAILRERHLRPDGLGVVGVGTTPGAVGSFAAMKGGGRGVVLRIELEAGWVSMQRVGHELGGSGHDQFLFHRVDMDWAGIPPEAIAALTRVRRA